MFSGFFFRSDNPKGHFLPIHDASSAAADTPGGKTVYYFPFNICGIVRLFLKKKLLKALAAPQLCSAAPPHAGMEFHEVSPAEEEEIRGEWGKTSHFQNKIMYLGNPKLF